MVPLAAACGTGVLAHLPFTQTCGGGLGWSAAIVCARAADPSDNISAPKIPTVRTRLRFIDYASKWS
jgi:hypothetical protein